MSVPAKRPTVSVSDNEISSYLKKYKLPKTSANYALARSRVEYDKQSEQLPKGRDISIVKTDAARQAVYGEALVGGVITFAALNSDNTILNLVVTLTGHPVESIWDVHLDKGRVDFSAVPGACYRFVTFDGTIITTNKVYFQRNNGSTTQTALSELVSRSVGWTSNHRQRGCAHALIALTWDASLFADGLPEIFCTIHGKKVYDPRNTLTEYSQNAALIIADYLTDTTFGLGVSSSLIDWDNIEIAADTCDELVTLADASTEARYQINGYFDFDESPDSVLKKMAAAIAGNITFSAGKWRVYPGVWRAPVLELTEDDCRGDLKIETQTSKRDLFNSVRGAHVNKYDRWEVTDYPPVVNSTYITADGGEELWTDLPLAYVTSPSACQRIAKIALEKVRQGIRVSGTFSLKSFVLQVADVVELTLPRMGWSAKTFEVESVDFIEEIEGDGPVISTRLVLVETAEGIYDWANGEETTYDISPNSNLPNPFDTTAITGLALESGTDHLYLRNDGTVFSRLYAEWNAVTDGYVLQGGWIRCQYKRHADSTWLTVADLEPDQLSFYILDVEDNVAYDFRVRTFNSVGAASSWTTVSNHTVIGKTEKPSNVTNFAVTIADPGVVFSWDAISDVDVASYEIRSGATWAGGEVIAQSRAIGTSLEYLDAGSYTFKIKAVDTSGNYSTTEATTTLTIVAPGVVRTLSAEVIDNNILFRWSLPETGTYQVVRYNFYKGATWETKSYVGSTDSTFKNFLEAVAGTFVYWIAAVDQAGTLGTQTSISVTVSQPPDFIAEQSILLELTDATTKTNVFVDTTLNKMFMPVVEETYQQHFDNTAWNAYGNQLESPDDVSSVDWYRENVTASGDTITASAGSARHNVRQPDSSVVAAQVYQIEVEVKYGNHRYLWIGDGGDANWHGGYFDFTAETFTANAYVDRSYVQKLASGWYRIRIFFTRINAGGTHEIYAAFQQTASAASPQTWTTAGTETFLYRNFWLSKWAETSPQDQVDAGYPYFLQPAAETALYVQSYTLGASINSQALVSLVFDKTEISGTTLITPTISLYISGAWVDYAGAYSVYGSGFTDVRVQLAVEAGDGLAFVKIENLSIEISLKEITESGTVSCLAADSGGTTVTFEKSFYDIQSLQVTAKYQAGETKGITAVYDFVDTPNPTSFKVLLYSNLTGARINGDAGWTITGV